MRDMSYTQKKIKELQEEIITVNENTEMGQKRLKEIMVELGKLNKGLLSDLMSMTTHK